MCLRINGAVGKRSVRADFCGSPERSRGRRDDGHHGVTVSGVDVVYSGEMNYTGCKGSPGETGTQRRALWRSRIQKR